MMRLQGPYWWTRTKAFPSPDGLPSRRFGSSRNPSQRTRGGKPDWVATPLGDNLFLCIVYCFGHSHLPCTRLKTSYTLWFFGYFFVEFLNLQVAFSVPYRTFHRKDTLIAPSKLLRCLGRHMTSTLSTLHQSRS